MDSEPDFDFYIVGVIQPELPMLALFFRLPGIGNGLAIHEFIAIANLLGEGEIIDPFPADRAFRGSSGVYGQISGAGNNPLDFIEHD